MMITAGLGMVDRDIEVGKEYKVGTFTLNGVTYDRYVKIVDCGAMPDTQASGQTYYRKDVPHGITFTGILSMSGVAMGSNAAILLPYYNLAYTAGSTGLGISSSNFVISSSSNLSASYTKTLVTVEYYR